MKDEILMGVIAVLLILVMYLFISKTNINSELALANAHISTSDNANTQLKASIQKTNLKIEAVKLATKKREEDANSALNQAQIVFDKAEKMARENDLAKPVSKNECSEAKVISKRYIRGMK